MAQRRIAEAHIRCNGRRVTRRDLPVAVGDVITLPWGRDVRVIEILALPLRRGPAAEAEACYRMLDAGRSIAIAGAEPHGSAAREEGISPP